jgi:hypothetical protein
MPLPRCVLAHNSRRAAAYVQLWLQVRMRRFVYVTSTLLHVLRQLFALRVWINAEKFIGCAHVTSRVMYNADPLDASARPAILPEGTVFLTAAFLSPYLNRPFIAMLVVVTDVPELRRPLPGMLLFQDGSTHRWIAALGRVMISARARCPSPALSARSEIPRRSDHRRRCPGRRLFWSRSSGEECGRVPRGCGRP